MDVSVYAGTVGWGVWRSDDLGESWRSAFEGLPVEMRTWALSSHPNEPGVVWAGTDIGLLRQDEEGKRAICTVTGGWQADLVRDPKRIRSTSDLHRNESWCDFSIG